MSEGEFWTRQFVIVHKAINFLCDFSLSDSFF